MVNNLFFIELLWMFHYSFHSSALMPLLLLLIAYAAIYGFFAAKMKFAKALQSCNVARLFVHCILQT